MTEPKILTVGILAYGSLIDDPGPELSPLINRKIDCKTPFKIEFARLSKTRDFAPTLVPVTDGGRNVNAVILVLKEGTDIETAASMLWRRELHKSGTDSYRRPASPGKNSVLIETILNFHEIDQVLYTSIPQNMGMFSKPDYLAYFAIRSILSNAGQTEKDGVRYLLNAKENGIITEHSDAYEKAVLEQSGTNSLKEAIEKLDVLRPKNLKIEKASLAFEQEVTQIADLICEYGLEKTFGNNIPDLDKQQEIIFENKKEFLVNCHEGFKKAQTKIIALTLRLQEDKDNAVSELKVARASKDKSLVAEISGHLENLVHQEKIVRHLADTIVYQLLQGRIHVMRRLYLEVEGNIALRNSNLQSVIKVADEINTNPANMVVLSDLTGYVQSGDLIGLVDGKLMIGEVKEGEKNINILKIIEEAEAEGATPDETREKHQLDDHSFKQLKRNIRQQQVMKMISEIVNTDKGIDPLTNQPFKFLTPSEEAPRYYPELQELKKHLDKNNLLSYMKIDDCLHVGMFKGPFRFLGGKILNTMYGKAEGKFIAMDMARIVDSINTPIFFLPFEKEFIFDILFGRIKLLFILDLDDYIKVFELHGYKAEWATRKETTRAAETINKIMKGLIVRNNQGIKIKVDDSSDIWLFAGSVLKIFFNHIYPKYQAYTTRYHL